MKSIKFTILFIALILFSDAAGSQKEKVSRNFFFIQITDPQLGFLGDEASYAKEKLLYTKAVEEVNRLDPDFVVITGDLVHNNTDSAKWSEFRRITALI
ncbi:MAG: serine/threonine protein phosphatase, partial [Bacteroidales bacterium]|nr:serine/threonine protein phosphatase [Bacteroidales bacterium]